MVALPRSGCSLRRGMGSSPEAWFTLSPGLWGRIKQVALTDVTVLVKGIDHDAIEDVERILLEADFGPESFAIAEDLERETRSGALKSDAAVREWLVGRIASLVTHERAGEEIFASASGEPKVALFVGVNGVGKTTQVAKLAHRLASTGESVLLAAADTYRAGATEQLSVWAERLGVPVVTGKQGGDPAAVAYDAVSAARSRGIGNVLIDTAGRLHTQDGLMEELSKIERVVTGCVDGAPHETILVVDGTVGQNAIQQGTEFGTTVSLTGVIVTKLDGTAKGGAVARITRDLGVPVRYVGTGEGLEDIRSFDARVFAESLLSD
jgi:fused signal recognition particle receptor